ncbi:MAG: AbrB/MazE/SpoVT family DNA-binding domain-containing protein [bacterium]|nr:AbrB/MazE/SpoVT family DNA-binding domain-containing protein [bacterium]
MTGGMTLGSVVGRKGQVVIAEHIRDQLGIGPGWVAIQRAVGERVEMVFLPPEHRESLKGSLAPHSKASVPPSEWLRARERGWHEAADREL